MPDPNRVVPARRLDVRGVSLGPKRGGDGAGSWASTFDGPCWLYPDQIERAEHAVTSVERALRSAAEHLVRSRSSWIRHPLDAPTLAAEMRVRMLVVPLDATAAPMFLVAHWTLGKNLLEVRVGPKGVAYELGLMT